MNGSQTYNISRRGFLALAGLAGATALAGCGSLTGEGASSAAVGSVGEMQERTLFVFDTVVTLKCRCTSDVMEKAVDRCNYFEGLLSRTRAGSDVWNINQAAGAPVEVASETADVIAKALGYCERSGGLFDITIGAVSSLWDFHAGVKPADDAVAQAVTHVDYRCVSVNGTTVQLDDPAAAIDLGGIAKGYIADDLAALFREGGCESGIINLGGNAYVIGSKPDGPPWSIGVQDPNNAGQQVIAKLAGADLSVVTSGLYERTFVQDGVTYYHILDPKTGYPVETDLVSSSVASSSSLDGDAYATWMFLLGRDAALDLLESTPGLEGLVVDDAGTVSTTSGAEFELMR